MISIAGDEVAFLAAAPRSGTTLLSLILDRSPEVTCPPEIWQALPLAPLVRRSPHELRGSSDSYLAGMSRRELFSAAEMTDSTRAALSTLYTALLARKPGASVLVDKTPRYYKILDDLGEIFPEARFIVMSRNPLDVAASHKLRWGLDLLSLRTPAGLCDSSYDVYCAAQLIANASSRLGQRCLVLRYEDLVAAPAVTVEAVCQHLGVPYSTSLLDYHAGAERSAHHRSSLGDREVWSRESIDGRSIDRWQSELTSPEVEAVVSTIGVDVLHSLGYTSPIDVADDPESRAFLQRSMELSLAGGEAVGTVEACRTEASQLQIHTSELEASLRAAGVELQKAVDQSNAQVAQLEARATELRRERDDHAAAASASRAELLDAQAKLERLRYLWPWLHATEGYEATPELPRISIVTPSYQQGRFIERNIESVLAQNYPNFEHIVIDGGSTDETLDVLARYPHIRLVSEPDLGQSHAINKGLLLATGTIVAYLNSDDVYRPGAFEAAYKAFEQAPDAGVVMGECDYIDEADRVIGHLVPDVESLWGLMKYWGWEQSYCLPQQSSFWRKETLAQTGLFEVDHHYSMDYDMFIKMRLRTRFEILDQTLAGFRMHSQSKTMAQTHLMYLDHRRAARPHWPSWWNAKRWYLELASLRHTAFRLLNIAEHQALTLGLRVAPLRMTALATRHWPPILLRPRTVLTLASLAVPRFCARPFHALHRTYLRVGHRLAETLAKQFGPRS